MFGIEEILSEKTAEDIWNRANALLATEEYRCPRPDREIRREGHLHDR